MLKWIHGMDRREPHSHLRSWTHTHFTFIISSYHINIMTIIECVIRNRVELSACGRGIIRSATNEYWEQCSPEGRASVASILRTECSWGVRQEPEPSDEKCKQSLSSKERFVFRTRCRPIGKLIFVRFARSAPWHCDHTWHRTSTSTSSINYAISLSHFLLTYFDMILFVVRL